MIIVLYVKILEKEMMEMKISKTYNREASISRAYFLKYGYIGVIFVSSLILLLLGTDREFFLIPTGFIVLMSVHIILASHLFMDHYICLMQSMNHAVMDPTVRFDDLQKQRMTRTGYFIGGFFMLLSVTLIVAILWF